MANTIITPTIFAKEVIRNLERDVKLFRYVNRDYEGELEKAWDAVDVQTFPMIDFVPKDITWAWNCQTSKVGTWPWWAIDIDDLVIKKEKLVIDRYAQKAIRLSDYERIQSNLDLTIKLAYEYSQWQKRLFENEMLATILEATNIPPENIFNQWAPIDITKDNVYEKIEEMRVALEMQNVHWTIVLACTPHQYSMILQSRVYDYQWLATREDGILRLLSWVHVVPTTAITWWEMIMFKDKALNFVIQMSKVDERRATDGFYSNFLTESIWWKKIFDENAKAFAICYATK